MYLLPLLLTLSTLSPSLAHVLAPRSKVNGACTGAAGAPGVCIATSDCTSAGGTYISNACPNTPANIKCCIKSNCSTGGTCNWTSNCKTSSVPGLCPGPTDFQCCVPSGGGGGGHFPAPTIPKVGACKAAAVNGVKKIVAALPGTVRQIGCTRDCECGCSSCSDHCCGMATDLMCSSAGGVSGLPRLLSTLVVSGAKTKMLMML